MGHSEEKMPSSEGQFKKYVNHWREKYVISVSFMQIDLKIITHKMKRHFLKCATELSKYAKKFHLSNADNKIKIFMIRSSSKV